MHEIVTRATRRIALKEVLSQLADVYGSRHVMDVAEEILRERKDPLAQCSSRLYVTWGPVKERGIEFLACEGNYSHHGAHYSRLGDCAATWDYLEIGGLSTGYYPLGPKCPELFCHATEGHKGQHENPWTKPTRWATGEGQQQ